MQIGEAAFASCTALKSVVFSESAWEIGENAFSHCTALESVIFEKDFREIGESAFSNCPILKEVTFGEKSSWSTGEIKKFAFAECSNLSKLQLSSTVKYIGNYAFSGCNLSDVFLPDSILHIGEFAFSCNPIKESILFQSDKFGEHFCKTFAARNGDDSNWNRKSETDNTIYECTELSEIKKGKFDSWSFKQSGNKLTLKDDNTCEFDFVISLWREYDLPPQMQLKQFTRKNRKTGEEVVTGYIEIEVSPYPTTGTWKQEGNHIFITPNSTMAEITFAPIEVIIRKFSAYSDITLEIDGVKYFRR